MESNYFFQQPMMQRYLHHFSSQKFRREKNALLFLKQYSSSVPILKTAIDGGISHGGGFYIRYDKIGVVVDPGIGLVDLLHNFGYSILDIDYVIVTHEHMDHSADLCKILSLNNDYNRHCRDRKNLYFTKLKEHKISVVCDERTYASYYHLRCDCSVLYNIGDAVKDARGKDQVASFIFDDLIFSLTGVQHGDTPTYGLKICKHGNKTIGYSSDTRYYDGLEDFLNDSDLLVLNISEVNEHDMSREELKKTHLGYNGVVSVLSKVANVDKKKTFISEYTCLRSDNRIDIIRKLRTELGLNEIYPATVGLYVDTITGLTKCSLCGFCAKQPAIIKPKPQASEYLFVCENCRI